MTTLTVGASAPSTRSASRTRKLRPVLRVLLLVWAASSAGVLGSAETLAQNAYITNSGDNTVSVINTSTNKVIATIPVDNGPNALTVTPDGGNVYVANGGSASVSVIDPETNGVIDTISVGSGPGGGVAAAPDGSKVYVLNGCFDLCGVVSVIATATDTVIATIPVGDRPSGAAVSPDGRKVYVTNGFANSVSVIATKTNTVSDTIAVGMFPQFLAVTPDGGRVYVGNSNSNTVSVIETAHDTVIATIPVGSTDPNAGGSYPQGVAVSPDGSKVYVANSFLANSVSVISTATNTVIATIPVGSGPEGLAVTADGSKVYVANVWDYDISVINTATNKVEMTVPVGINPTTFGIFIQRPLGFAGTPGKSNCYGQSVSALTSQYHGMNAAAEALGYSSAKALQTTILAYCEA